MDHERVVRLFAAREIAQEPFGIAPVRGTGPRARALRNDPGRTTFHWVSIQLHAR
jgi:hypothetical protein